MADKCSDPEKEEVKAILMKIKEFTDTPENKVKLQNKIRECAKIIPLEDNYNQEELKKILQNTGISETDITAIVAAASVSAASGTPLSAQPSDKFEINDRVKYIKEGHYKDKQGIITKILRSENTIEIKLDNNNELLKVKRNALKKITTLGGGKRKSNKSKSKNKSKKNKSKKSKSKKSKSEKRSKKRKHRKMRRTRR